MTFWDFADKHWFVCLCATATAGWLGTLWVIAWEGVRTNELRVRASLGGVKVSNDGT